MALTTALTNGRALGLLDGLGGLTVGVLNGRGGSGGEAGGSGSGGSGGGAGPGGLAGQGSGSQGAAGPGTAATIVVDLPSTQSPAAQARTGAAGRGVVRILSHRVKGRVATIVVQTPAAGKVTLSGRHVRSSSRLPGAAERVTLKVTLAKATAASLHSHRRHLAVRLKASFKPTSGAASSAAVTVTFA